MATTGDGDDMVMMTSMDADDSKVDYEKYDNNESESDHSIQSYDDCSSLLPSFKILPQVTFEKCVLTIGQVDTTTLSEDIRQQNFVITGYKPSLIIEKENASVEDIIKISDLIQKYMEHKQTYAPFPVLSENHGRLELNVKDSCEEKDKVSVGCKNTLTSEDTDVTELTKMLEDFNMKEDKKKEQGKNLPALQKKSTIDKSLTSKRPQTGETKKKSNTLTKLTNMANTEHDREEPDCRKTKDQVMPTINKEYTKKNEFNVLQAPKETMQSPTVKHSLPPMDNSCLGNVLESDREGLEDDLEVESRANKNSVEKKSYMKQAFWAQEDMKGNQGSGHFRNGADKMSHGKAGDRKMSEFDRAKNIEKEHLRQEKFSEADHKRDIELKPQDSAVKKTHCCAQHEEEELKNKKLKDEKYDLETSTKPQENFSEADHKQDIELKPQDSAVKKTHCCAQHEEQELKTKKLKDKKYHLETSMKYNEPRENYSDTQSDEDDKPGVNLISISKKGTEFKALKFYFADTEYNSYFTKEQSIEIDGNSKQGKFFMKILNGIGIETVTFSFINQERLQSLNFDEGNVKLHLEKNKIILVGPKGELKPVKSKIITLFGNQDHSTQWQTKQNTADMEDEEDKHDFESTDRNKDKIASQGACKRMDKEQLDMCKSDDRHRTISTTLEKKRFTFKSPGCLPYYLGHNNNKLSITIEHLDITKLRVDVVVNAANMKLKHHGGVARAIANAAGEDLTQECTRYIYRNEKLAVTDVFVSTAGKLPSKMVMHAVGPKWEVYEDKILCVNDLRQTVLRCLIEASRLGMSSIALPSISAAIFKVPKDKCAKCYMEATKNYDYISFSLHLQPLKKICFVDVDTNTLNTIQDYFIKWWDWEPDENQMQDDIDFVMRHLSQIREKELKSTSSKIYSAPSSDVMKNPSASSRNLTAAERELEDYLIGDIFLRVRTEPALNFKACVNIVLGPAFNKLSGIPDFKVKKNLSPPPQSMPEMKDSFKYFSLNKSLKKPQQSGSALLCSLLPLPKTEDELKTCFEHLTNLVFKNSLLDDKGKSPISVTLTSSLLFPENLKEKNLHKLVGKFAAKLFEFIETLSQANHTITKVTVCTSEETAPQVTKVFDSRKPKKVSRRSQGINSHSRNEPESVKSGRNSVVNQPAGTSQSFDRNHHSHVPSQSHTVQREIMGSYKGGASYNQATSGGCPGKACCSPDYTSSYKAIPDLVSSVDSQDCCSVCFESINIESLKCCQGLICSTCLGKVSICPYCRFHFKILIGKQPPNGEMRWIYSPLDVYGYERKGSLEIDYYIPPGKQIEELQHSSPGKQYMSVTRTAYLPATDDGYRALRLLIVAFHRRLIFTIDVSHTTQREGIVWNIHHKTSRHSSEHGYPDPKYLMNLMLELSQNGVTEDSMTQEERRLVAELMPSFRKI